MSLFVTYIAMNEENSEENLKNYIRVLLGQINQLKTMLLYNDKLIQSFNFYKDEITKILDNPNQTQKDQILNLQKEVGEIMLEYSKIYQEIENMTKNFSQENNSDNEQLENYKNLVNLLQENNNKLFNEYIRIRELYVLLQDENANLKIECRDKNSLIDQLTITIENLQQQIQELNKFVVNGYNISSNSTTDYKNKEIEQLNQIINELNQKLEQLQTSYNESQKVIIKYEGINLEKKKLNVNVINTLKIIIDKYETLHMDKHEVFEFINKSEINDELKEFFKEVISKIINDQNIRETNFSLLEYINLTNSFYEQIKEIKTEDKNIVIALIRWYLSNISTLNINSANIKSNKKLLTNYLVKLENQKYDVKKKLENDIKDIERKFITNVGNVETIETTSHLRNSQSNDNKDIIFQVKLIMSLVIYSKLLNITKKRSTLEQYKSKYNEYAGQINQLSPYIYDQFPDECPNTLTVGNINNSTTAKLQEIIQTINKIPKEHEKLTSAGIVFKDIVGEEEILSIEEVQERIDKQDIERKIINMFNDINNIIIFISNK